LSKREYWHGNLALHVFRLYGGKIGLAPTALLGFGGGYDHGFVVGLGGMVIDGGSGLGAEVASPDVKIESRNAVLTPVAGELHSALDAMNLVGFH
jgi:hypothetical protein